MKSPCIHFDQSLLDNAKLMINQAKGFKWNRLFAMAGITSDRVNYYLTLLLKQIFSDNFSGSDAETGMALIFLKSYVLSATAFLSNNVIIDFVKNLKKQNARVLQLGAEENFNYNKAA
ncbi:hypothetical protein [Mucilaginibacter sp. BT774]|uniref:hypothetical protein n=1 Tax=Mucilaginibacter sp. BT774 TaxID=3062276 RepID=UPI002676D9F6|nr:hypothetical protein [Mucilaginibacter sp. BT774]MDO3627734.1 hypothetical protein [Mucilaginibacter sp. BT774]